MSEYMPTTTTPEELELANKCINKVYDAMRDMTRSFFQIGYILSEARDKGYYRALGYATIEDLAADKFDFERATTYNFMQVYRFARDWHKPMCIAEQYEKFSRSQLLEMSRGNIWARDDLINVVKPTDRVADIRDFIKIWNREYRKTGRCPKGDTVSEVLERYGAKQPKLPTAPAQPQLSIVDLSEVPAGAELVHTYGQSVEIEEPEEEKVQISGKSKDEPEQSIVQKPEKQAPVPADDEVISECLRRDRNKREIYNKCLTQPSKEEFIKYLKELRGNSSETWQCGKYFYREYSVSKGIILTGHNCPKLVISWSLAAGRIKKLIETKSYLTEDELGFYPERPAPVTPEWSDEDTAAEEPAEEYFQTSENAPTPGVAQTNREQLSVLSDSELAEKLCLKILQLFPMHGKSAQFLSEVRPKLAKWLSEPCEVTE